jgi:hypothetical protein
MTICSIWQLNSKYFITTKLLQSSAVLTIYHTVQGISLQYIACETQFYEANLHARSYKMVVSCNAKVILRFMFRAIGQVNRIALCNYTENFRENCLGITSFLIQTKRAQTLFYFRGSYSARRFVVT